MAILMFGWATKSENIFPNWFILWHAEWNIVTLRLHGAFPQWLNSAELTGSFVHHKLNTKGLFRRWQSASAAGSSCRHQEIRKRWKVNHQT